jgi:P-type Cu2+ transporter
MSRADQRCFHCGEPVPEGAHWYARIQGRAEPVCCAGCRAVAELIAGAGLGDFYRFRSGPSRRPEPQAPAEDWSAYDQPQVADRVSSSTSSGARSVTLVIEGVRCAACGWLIDRMLRDLPGIEAVSVNAATARARVEWRPQNLGLGAILRTIAALGYQPHPCGSAAARGQPETERRAALKRLAVAGLGMMQVMTFAVAMYAGDSSGMASDLRLYLRVVSLLVATPVLLYAGRPFFTGAWRSIRARSVGMDVPVSIALALAWSASVVNTLRGSGAVYFDSVTMFVFFLTLARYVEMLARHRATDLGAALTRLSPAVAHRLADDRLEDVLVEQIATGDLLMVRAGETIPADGVVVAGEGRFDESLLTGEALPVARCTGEPVTAGAVNAAGPVRIRVTATGAATALAGIVALLERAQASKPRLARNADRTASWFLGRVLVAAALVAGVWLVIDPARAFETTLAVLVVTCPCALSLATPAAMAAATARLARSGMLVCSADAVEQLARVTHVVFDKTGTLTLGRMHVTACEPLASLPAGECLRIAAALESSSEHPIARAFAREATAPASDVVVCDGRGVEGRVDGHRYRIGSPAFIYGAADLPGRADEAQVVLADDTGPLATFRLGDRLRPEAPAAVRDLAKQGIGVTIVSGDAESAVFAVAEVCGAPEYRSRCLPADKVEVLRERASRGDVVAMVGDGINDAPVLRTAHVSIAMGHGSALAQSSADAVLPRDSLAAIVPAIGLAQRTVRVVRQNLLWAAAYNLCALPLAAFGLVPPWLAAIGMSMSSVLVVLNALRLAARPAGRRAGRGGAALDPLAGTS